MDCDACPKAPARTVDEVDDSREIGRLDSGNTGNVQDNEYILDIGG